MVDIAGIPYDQIIGIVVYLAAFPLALLHSLIRNPTIRHIYGVFCFLLFTTFLIECR